MAMDSAMRRTGWCSDPRTLLAFRCSWSYDKAIFGTTINGGTHGGTSLRPDP